MKELLLRRKGKFIQYLFATFLFIIDHFVQMVIFALILGAIQKGDLKYYRTVVMITVIFVLYAPLNFILSRMLRLRYMRDTILDVRKQAFDKIINLSFKQFSQKSKEIYISNLINDVNTFENKFFNSLLNYLINMGTYLLSLMVLVVLDYKLAIGMFLFSLLLFGLARLFTKKMTVLEQNVSTYNEQFTTDMSNTFNGIEILKLNNIEEKFLLKSIGTINRAEQKKYAANVFSDLQRNVIRILAFAVSVGVMIYLAYGFQRGASLAQAGLVFQLCSSISNFLINAFPMLNQIKASVSIYEKIANPDEYTQIQSKNTREFEFQNQITLEGVNFSYDKKTILNKAAFTIEKGKKYLIKGVSGSGKSTLMNLLAMANDEYEGNITADGVNYREISEKSFHDKVAFVYQDVFLFEDTIKNNIALYKDIPEEQIAYAAKVCGLMSIIEDKKEGIHAKLTENGGNLSGGQRQRISVARAIAKNAEILFVDEGTSSLNEELGREIEKLFLNLNNTVIAISHRFYEGVTDQYDYVLELKNGMVNRYTAKEYFNEVITW
ncbi:ABC transporter ATP-binding protein [Anaerocolumna sp. AGMB13025]|uniref:ATP-binding cassette domain-containing protein n=1 Tax=Anaerocolumna sp. AGMB13025 TaxID=3039116 RepID=UPI00241C11DE|nr:ABC transporter ATP-binding protein [Anaerocolumna sp. AGMB13025]WFR58778.1 ABC transporter ATP-binding protein [Anaerocolumna sp. AGMB13025]